MKHTLNDPQKNRNQVKAQHDLCAHTTNLLLHKYLSGGSNIGKAINLQVLHVNEVYIRH